MLFFGIPLFPCHIKFCSFLRYCDMIITLLFVNDVSSLDEHVNALREKLFLHQFYLDKTGYDTGFN